LHDKGIVCFFKLYLKVGVDESITDYK
jgi:hypothetical protein